MKFLTVALFSAIVGFAAAQGGLNDLPPCLRPCAIQVGAKHGCKSEKDTKCICAAKFASDIEACQAKATGSNKCSKADLNSAKAKKSKYCH